MEAITLYERLRFLAQGETNAYKHGIKENQKTKRLQEFLDSVYNENPEYFNKLHQLEKLS